MIETVLICFKSGNSVRLGVTSITDLINEVSYSINKNNKYLLFGGVILLVNSIECIVKVKHSK